MLHQRLYFFLLSYYDYARVHPHDFAHVFNDANGRVYALFHDCVLPYDRVYHDSHGYVYAICRVCVHAHLFIHDFLSDYVFFINDLTIIPNFCDHDFHPKFLQNHHF